MQLDMLTISAVDITATAVLGFVLVLAWARDRTSPFVGLWGLAQLIQSAAIIVTIGATLNNQAALITIGVASMVLSFAIMWMAARQFEGRELALFWIFLGPLAYLIAVNSGYFATHNARLILSSSVFALFSFAIAIEFWRDGAERPVSRWPAVVLLVAIGASFLSWLPLALTMPIPEAGSVFASQWFPAVILATILGRIALAFVVLAMAKERQELKQRIDALTDPLTGLPNRRALFEAADVLARHSRFLKGDPVSVLVFDLDHFKKINDAFGHRLGDRVLQLFARTLSKKMGPGSILGRLGGEEFAAILPGADLTVAAIAAEDVRAAFANSAAFIDGVAVAGTVSVGAASHHDIDCDLGTLFHRADGALYAAKNAGRNRVELVSPHEATHFVDGGALASSSLGSCDGQAFPALENLQNTRRYRRSKLRDGNHRRSRRAGPPPS